MLLMMLSLMRMTEPSGWATLELTNTNVILSICIIRIGKPIYNQIYQRNLKCFRVQVGHDHLFAKRVKKQTQLFFGTCVGVLRLADNL